MSERWNRGRTAARLQRATKVDDFTIRWMEKSNESTRSLFLPFCGSPVKADTGREFQPRTIVFQYIENFYKLEEY